MTLTNTTQKLYDGIKKHGRKAAKVASYVALAATPDVALAQDVTVKGDITAKTRTSEEVPAPIREGDERFRLNFLVNGGKWYFAGRHDASFGDAGTGYGGFAVRRALDRDGKYQLGVGTVTDLRYDANSGEWKVDHSPGVNFFVKPAKGFTLMANVPPGEPDYTQLVAQYTTSLGPVEFRAFAKDNLGLPRLQKTELEISSPPVEYLGGGQFTVQGNLMGTPTGYKRNFEVGMKWKFGPKRR